MPDFAGIVLDPARPRVVLAEFALPHAAHCAGAVEHDGAGAGRALVQRQDEFICRHGEP
ncbi:Uncharacterised protein [Bordetella pertussis]|nr:Uncharacterised protein [Bordetella pertussis]